MISRSENITDSCFDMVQNQETEFLPIGPPPKESSYKGDTEVLHQRGKSLGVEQCVDNLRDKGMQTQYEVNNFSRVTLISKLNFSLLFHSSDLAHL